MSETPITGKVLVLYHSGTGHTAQMAKHVAEGVERYDGALMELRVRTVEEATAEDIFWFVFKCVSCWCFGSFESVLLLLLLLEPLCVLSSHHLVNSSR